MNCNILNNIIQDAVIIEINNNYGEFSRVNKH